MAQQKASKVITALTACEYSHWVRRLYQFSGCTDQLSVAAFAGWVMTMKMTSLSAISAARTVGREYPRASRRRHQRIPKALRRIEQCQQSQHHPARADRCSHY
ncbi:hypothetical protein G9X67_05140 [Rhizobium sp. WYCCWR 11152]|uniref:hypothetical protein n=1 Tax=Rhizobium sp. WYCCWR 11152 TaxID=2692316 RepID=UPI001492EB2E|nr:hypothetical protein [Rhizobium sp. WYCCWR 11152]NNU64675.1 hypothetical protein [Rhizobium sp. WYCCWR 11152]